MTKSKEHQAYGRFVFAATIYAAGVIAFSTWSYFQHRATLLSQIDQSLVDATYATEQILGSIFIQCVTETDALFKLGYASNKKKLEQFANACNFDILCAATHNQTNVRALIAGIGSTGVESPDDIAYYEKIKPELSSIILELASSKNETLRIQNLNFKEAGLLRVAIRYQPTTAHTGYALLVARNIDYVNSLMRAHALRRLALGSFLLLMTVPLIALYTRARQKSLKNLAELNKRLQQDVKNQAKREAELEDAIHDLERFNNVAVGRENRVLELKSEVNTLLEQMNRKKRYNVDHVE